MGSDIPTFKLQPEDIQIDYITNNDVQQTDDIPQYSELSTNVPHTPDITPNNKQQKQEDDTTITDLENKTILQKIKQKCSNCLYFLKNGIVHSYEKLKGFFHQKDVIEHKVEAIEYDSMDYGHEIPTSMDTIKTGDIEMQDIEKPKKEDEIKNIDDYSEINLTFVDGKQKL